MEINHWAKLVKSGLVRANLENPVSDLLIIGHYGGFSTYKQDAWSGYAMKISDFVAEVSGITDLLPGPGILITGTGPVKTVSIDGTFGGGTNFNVQPSGPIQVSKNEDPLDGNLINISNLDTLNIHALALASGLNWAGQWNPATAYAENDVVWYEDPDTGTYYTYWAYDGAITPGTLLPTAGQASANGWARLGLEGPTGNPGYSTAIMKLYQWSTTQPTVFPSDSSVYTWDDGSFTLPSDFGLWSATIPATPVADETLWEISKQYTAYPIGTSEAIAWAGSGPAKAIAYFGNTGTDGKTVLSGSGAPDNSLGENGDFYIDTASVEYTMYGPKAGGNWTTNPTKDLKGDDGTAGSITYSVAGTAPGTLGVTGDYYIDTTSTNYTMYGPKPTDTSWSGADTLNLKGPAGNPGTPGATGAVGVGGFRTISSGTSSWTLLATAALGTPGLTPTPQSTITQADTTDTNDAGVFITSYHNAGTFQLIIPNRLPNFPVGFQVSIMQIGTSQVEIKADTITAPDVPATISSANNMKHLRTQYSAATLIKVSSGVVPVPPATTYTSDVWYLFGDLTNVVVVP